MDRLPIDEVLSQIEAALKSAPRAVLRAPPGAGKTTRVPWHLAECFPKALVLVAEPRRLAAKLAAERVARERQQRTGDTVGYSVRMEHVAGAHTRIMYMTDGVLLRRLVSGPLPRGSLVVLDEFHERRLQNDLCLALLLDAQRRRSSDLRLLVMSATLDTQTVAAHLGGCPEISSEGRCYELAIRHLPRPDERPLEKQVVSACRELLGETSGDVLVFLPGAHEIRLAQSALGPLQRQRELLLAPLHGDLPLAEQTKAVQRQRLRKIVLSTNVAESSITVENVTGVVDSGLARVPIHDVWSGMDRLGVHKVSQASLIQRAGRAGRTSPGSVLRLFSLGDFRARAASETPEIQRLDLCEVLLLLKSAGVNDPFELPWLTPPHASAVDAARALLSDLQAMDASGSLTSIGRRLSDFPVHPRLARLVVEGERRGVALECCLLATLLSERDIQSGGLAGPAHAHAHIRDSDSDLIELLELYRQAEERDFRADSLRQLGLEPRAVSQVRAGYQKLRRLVRQPPSATAQVVDRDEALQRCVLAAFVDRLAQRTEGKKLLLTSGKVAELSQHSALGRAPLMVAVSASERVEHAGRTRALVRLASRVHEQWLFEDYIERLEDSDTLEYNPRSERVERVSRIRAGRITLDETRSSAQPGPRAAEILLRAALAKGVHNFDEKGELEQLLVRLDVLREHCPELWSAGVTELTPERILAQACQGATSLAELKNLGLASAVWTLLPQGAFVELERQVPLVITLANGRRLKIAYVPGKQPYLASRLQDFFSTSATPAICQGRLPLQVHLLAPNQRAVQVTRDLAGFWERHYPELRKQLMRRYPKHSWPEDGRTASPPAQSPRRPPR